MGARGLSVGSSLVEDDFIETAKQAEALAEAKGCKLILPSNVVVADAFAPDANTQVVAATEIPDGWMGLDNGPEATKEIQTELAECKTIVWNGPMGFSSSMLLPREPSMLLRLSLSLPQRAHAPSLAAVTRLLLLRRLDSQRRCPTSPLAAVLPSSSLRARSFLVLLH